MSRISFVTAVLVTCGIASAAPAFQVCAKEDSKNLGHPKEKAKLFLKTTCDPLKHEVPVGLEVAGTVGTDAVVKVSGANLQVVSGSGTTDGAVNGLGNVIVGYNETGFCSATPRKCNTDADCPSGENCNDLKIPNKSGSHNIITGQFNSYSSYGGVVFGVANTSGERFATVTGGVGNEATGVESSISGGYGNSASGDYASISGGQFNTASGTYSWGGGGVANQMTAYYSAAAGGACNVAGPGTPSTSGQCIVAQGQFVGGGLKNAANGPYSSVTGGSHNTASGTLSSVSGGDTNQATGLNSSVSGGVLNIASGTQSSVSGGIQNLAGTGSTSVFGGALASGQATSVTGGNGNQALGGASSVGGGTVPVVTGGNEWHAGRTSGFPTGTLY